MALPPVFGNALRFVLILVVTGEVCLVRAGHDWIRVQSASSSRKPIFRPT